MTAPGPDTSTCTCTSQGQVWVAGTSPQLGGDQVQTLAQCSAAVRWGILSQDDVHSGNNDYYDHANYNDDDDDARLCPACCWVVARCSPRRSKTSRPSTTSRPTSARTGSSGELWLVETGVLSSDWWRQQCWVLIGGDSSAFRKQETGSVSLISKYTTFKVILWLSAFKYKY